MCVRQSFEATAKEDQKHAKIIERAAKYQWPPGSSLNSDAELDSFLVHTTYFKRSTEAVEPNDQLKEIILNVMESSYRDCAVEVDHFDTRANFDRCLRSLEFQASPGHPYMFEKSTIGEWLGFDGAEFNTYQVERLWSHVLDLMRAPEIDCLWRVFIKQEPHKEHKIRQKRYRLIMCPPLHVQVLWQMLFSEQNGREIDQAYYIPSQQGLMLPYGHWKLFYDQWKSQGVTWGTDAVAWDWNLPGWVFQLDLAFRKRQTRGKRTDDWMHQAAKLYRNAFRDCKIALSSGRVFQQQHWGIMKSGCVNTISTNSHGGVMYHVIYCYETGASLYPLPKCVGDDKLVAEEHAAHLEVYEKYGNYIKSVSPNLEFVGHEFTGEGPRPMYFGKHVFNLLYAKPELVLDILDSYLRMNALYDEGWEFWMAVARNLGLASKVLSRSYYRAWYNDPDGARWFKC